MKKNGSYFFSIVERSAFRAGIWDTFSYRERKQSDLLEHFAQVMKVRAAAASGGALEYAPIEYRHIPRGRIPIFILEQATLLNRCVSTGVPEGSLLFGTMRAYLGNVLVTPEATWLEQESPLVFSVKSEFVQVVPKDGLVYFWWAFLQSPSFLQALPVGGGGTRPRLDTTSLLQTPVEVPLRAVREKIHRQILHYAKIAWQEYRRTEVLLTSTLE